MDTFKPIAHEQCIILPVLITDLDVMVGLHVLIGGTVNLLKVATYCDILYEYVCILRSVRLIFIVWP